jgi:hypothetical protein
MMDHIGDNGQSGGLRGDTEGENEGRDTRVGITF